MLRGGIARGVRSLLLAKRLDTTAQADTVDRRVKHLHGARAVRERRVRGRSAVVGCAARVQRVCSACAARVQRECSARVVHA